MGAFFSQQIVFAVSQECGYIFAVMKNNKDDQKYSLRVVDCVFFLLALIIGIPSFLFLLFVVLAALGD